MSTMPAEGSQSPSMELPDLSDRMSTSAVTKAKIPDDSTPQLLNVTGHLPSVRHGMNTNNHVEVQDSMGRLSPPAPSTFATATAAADWCQGTAHFYRQTTERSTPSTSWNSSQHKLRVNGGTTTCRSAVDGTSPDRCQSMVTADEWLVPSTSVAMAGSSSASSFPPYQEECRGTNGYRQSEPAHHNGQGPGDDMENYLNANAHMLAYLDLQAGGEGESPGGAIDALSRGHHLEDRRQSSSDDTRSLSGVYHNGYGSDDGIIVNRSVSSSGRSQDGLSGNHVKLSTSSEDFIETDISLPPPDMESSIQCSSSEEDLPKLTSLSSSSRYRKRQIGYSSDSARRPCEGPKLLPPASVLSTHSSTVCDYKSRSTSEASRPASFGGSSRLCTCSVVSYSRRRPLAPSNQSSSDLEADEGVGGMKASPVELSPMESDVGQACGITVTTSDSSSYFSPEDVDFLDFDMATPHSDNVDEAPYISSNIQRPEDHLQGDDVCHSHGSPHSAQEGDTGSSNRDICDECGKREQHCLCVSLRACKRLLEGAIAQQQQLKQTTTSVEHVPTDGSSNCMRLCNNVSNRTSDRASAMAPPHCTCCAGRDSGSGSQEHLDALSFDEPDEDDDEQALPSPHHMACSCLYLGCSESGSSPPHRVRQEESFSCDDTNNLDVEVFSAAPSSDYEDELFNVSRQTSTSNFDQDENAYQVAVEDCASNGFHSACSNSSDLESEKSNHITNHPEEECEAAECPGMTSVATDLPPEIPLPIPSRSLDHAPRLPPSLPPPSPAEGAHHLVEARNLVGSRQLVGGLSGCLDGGGGDERAGWLGEDADADARLSSQHQHQHPGVPPHWAAYDVPSDQADATQRRQWAVPAWATGDEEFPTCAARYSDHRSNAQADARPSYSQSSGVLPGNDERSLRKRGQMLDRRENSADDFQNQTVPDPLPEIFILNLLREKESRAQAACHTRSAVEKVMIWNEYEAYVLQVKQIGASACGATAVINILKAFNIYVEKAAASGAIQTNTRAEKAPIAEYLLSRSVAGCTAEHLMTGMETVTRGDITGRFFCFYPEREVDILHWLGTWMKKDAVAVMTLNLQRAVPQGWDVPDAWHHQMVYGVGPKGVYLTNPLEVVPEEVVRDQLTSPSELLVQRQDVIARWSPDTDLGVLLAQPDTRWRHLNVIGQVVNVLREARRPRVLGFRPQLTPHIRIPAWYRPGITLFVRRGSQVHQELMNAPPLPLRVVPPSTTKSAPKEPAEPATRPAGVSGAISASRSLDEPGVSSSEWLRSNFRQPRHSLDQAMSSSGQSANSPDRLAGVTGLSASTSGPLASGSGRPLSSSRHNRSSSSGAVTMAVVGNGVGVTVGVGAVAEAGAGAWYSEASTSTVKQKQDQSPEADVANSVEELREAEDGFEDSPDGLLLDSSQDSLLEDFQPGGGGGASDGSGWGGTTTS